MEIRAPERQKGIIALVLLTVAYGILPVIPRYLSTSFSLLQQVYLRMALGFIISLIIFRRHIRFPRLLAMPGREWGILLARAAIYYVFGVTMYTQAILLTKISNVVVIGAIPMTAILGFLILREKATAAKIAMVLLSAAGVFIVSIRDYANIFSFGAGELIALAATLFVSLGIISRRFHDPSINDREISTILLFFAAALIFLTSLIMGEGLPVSGWSTGLLLALFLGGVLNAGVSYFMNYGFSRVDAVLGGNILAMEPVAAAMIAFAVFRELPVAKEILGGAIIIASCIGLNRLEKGKA